MSVPAKNKPIKNGLVSERPSVFVSNKNVIEESSAIVNKFQKPFNFSHIKETSECADELNEGYILLRDIVRNQYLLYLKEICAFKLCGHIQLTVLSGSLNVFGFKILPGATVTFHTDIESGYYEFTSVPSNREPLDLEETLKDQVTLSEEDFRYLKTNFKPNDNLILLESAEEPKIYQAIHYWPYEPQCQLRFSSIKDLNCSLIVEDANSYKCRSIKELVEWKDLNLGLRTVITGGKDMGKSTCLKYCVNKLLNYHKRVVVLDMDPGQPEFSCPGSVSVTVVKEPVFGPNYLHNKDSELVFHLGFVDVTRCYSSYCQVLKDIMAYCLMAFPNLPWVINTMGFSKGLGVVIILKTINVINPTTVIQINSKNSSKNYPFDLDGRQVFDESSKIFDETALLHYELIKLESANETETFLPHPRKAKDLRDLMTLSYFSRILSPPDYNFLSVIPYCVPFHQVCIGVRAPIAPRDILKVINGIFVSLERITSIVDKDVMRCSDPSFFQIVVKPPLSPSFGMGLVRGIDIEKRTIYLLTPLDLNTLTNVNLLMISELNVPHNIYLKQNVSSDIVPYTAVASSHRPCVSRQFRLPNRPSNENL